MNKTSFVVFPNFSDYCDVMVRDVGLLDNVYFYRSPQGRLFRTLWLLHTSIKSNKRFRLPFQSIWFNYYLPFDSARDNVVFLFFQGNALGYDDSFHRFLRRKYPNCKLAFFWFNLINSISAPYLPLVQNNYDYIFSSEYDDCIKYGWIFHEELYSNLTKELKDEELSSDIFFCANAKGRVDIVHNIYEKLVSSGLKCDFHVVNVPKQEQKYDGISYNKRLSYSEVLVHSARSRILLEVIQKGQSGCTLRTCEAIALKKILLTNHQGIKETPLFGDYVFTFSNIDEINPQEILSKKIDDESYERLLDYISPIRLIERISLLIEEHNGENK